MEIYLAWSGKRSEAVASAFKRWLPLVFQQLSPFFSPNDIEKGAKWANELSQKLESCHVGLLFVTPESLDSKWLLFEAGALSKISGSKVVCIGFDDVHIGQPLSQFQNVQFKKEDITKLMSDIHQWNGTEIPPLSVVEASVEMWWSKLESEVIQALKQRHDNHTEEVESSEDVSKEILELARINAQSLSRMEMMINSLVTDTSLFGTKDAKPPFKAGDKVHHIKFGVGTVRRVRQIKDDWEITVQFLGDLGVKRLIQRFAGLVRVYSRSELEAATESREQDEDNPDC